jgi:thymidylate kinase
MVNREVMPSEKKHPRLIKKIKELDKELPKPPFFMIIQGSVGSGKTSLLYSLLKAYQDKNFFDVIIFYNRVSDSDEVWEKFETKKTAIELYHDYNDAQLISIIDDLDKVQSQRREKKKRPLNVLFVFDDMAYSNIVRKNKSTALDQLVINRRHYNTSLIITSQTYKALNINLRTNNLSQLVLLRANLKDLKMIAEDHNAGMIEEKEFINLYEEVKKGGQYDFLVVDYQDKPENIFKRNFKEVIKIED